jgi:hypothetical protein
MKIIMIKFINDSRILLGNKEIEYNIQDNACRAHRSRQKFNNDPIHPEKIHPIVAVYSRN